MSGYTSGNNAPTLMRQAPNRRGNQDKTAPSHNTGVTAVTRPEGNTHYAPGHQGAPKVGAHGGKNAGVTSGRGQKVTVSMPKPYCTYTHNDGYRDSDRTNYLK